jgi:hypothetical protein
MDPPSPDSRLERREARRRAVRRRRLTGLAILVLLAAGAAVGVAVATRGPDAVPAGESVPAATLPGAAVSTAATTETVAEAPQARPAAPAGATVTIAATGDIVMGTTAYGLPPDGGRSFFDLVDQELRGDVVLGNLEGTLSTGGSSKCGAGSTDCFAFQTPPSYARWLKRAGFTVLNLANNHAYDYGASGYAQTQRALRKAGLRITGRRGQITLVDAGPVRVALLGFASYPWANDLTNVPAARRLVREAAARADVVVVTFHGGAEGASQTHVEPGTEYFLGENRGDPVRFSHAVIDAGADLVVGHGPHVLRGMEWYKGRLIAYSLGNFGGYEVFSLGGPLSVSGILRVTLAGDGTWLRGELVATQLVGAGIPALDPAERAHGAVRELSRADFGARGMRVAVTGRLRPPRAA